MRFESSRPGFRASWPAQRPTACLRSLQARILQFKRAQGRKREHLTLCFYRKSPYIPLSSNPQTHQLIVHSLNTLARTLYLPAYPMYRNTANPNCSLDHVPTGYYRFQGTSYFGKILIAQGDWVQKDHSSWGRFLLVLPHKGIKLRSARQVTLSTWI